MLALIVIFPMRLIAWFQTLPGRDPGRALCPWWAFAESAGTRANPVPTKIHHVKWWTGVIGDE